MLFRKYTSDDFERLYAVETACFEPSLRFTRSYMRTLLNKKQTSCWLAEQDGELASFGIVEMVKRGRDRLAYLATLEVQAEFRRQGIGREVLTRLEEDARQAGAQSIWLHVDEHNRDAIGLYEAADYSVQGRQEDYYPQGHAALVYARQLAEADAPGDLTGSDSAG